MCGIVGYFGKQNAVPLLQKGLGRLSYRGYDSWGFGLKEGNSLKIIKEVGDIEKAKINGTYTANIGIAHTRWATNGEVNQRNSHPHVCSSGVAVIHNGIVENADELKAELSDHTFHSETDTEVIAHLIGTNVKKGMEFPEAVRQAFLRLKGRNAIVAMHKDFDGLVGVKFGSPMVVGIKDDEYFIGSDIMAFSDETNKVVYLDDNEMVVVR
jgi:glutamine---fructose-6-phosphate transaminase (isomerizing)